MYVDDPAPLQDHRGRYIPVPDCGCAYCQTAEVQSEIEYRRFSFEMAMVPVRRVIEVLAADARAMIANEVYAAEWAVVWAEVRTKVETRLQRARLAE